VNVCRTGLLGRSRNLGVWAFTLWGICLLAASGGPLAGTDRLASSNVLPAAVGVLSQAPDAAIIPARIAAEIRAGGATAPLRVLVIAAVLAMLAGLPAILRRRTAAPGSEHRPLRARRHTIALRAPPLRFA
jgi:hypothetical protein